jgi:hypothetical protein
MATFTELSPAEKKLTPADIVPGGRYRGGKVGRIRVVESIGGVPPEWVWWHKTTCDMARQCVHIDTFIRWAKQRV